MGAGSGIWGWEFGIRGSASGWGTWDQDREFGIRTLGLGWGVWDRFGSWDLPPVDFWDNPSLFFCSWLGRVFQVLLLIPNSSLGIFQAWMCSFPKKAACSPREGIPNPGKGSQTLGRDPKPLGFTGRRNPGPIPDIAMDLDVNGKGQ